MTVVRVASEFPGTVHEAESCWCDTSRWPAWVDGLDHVVETAGGWPKAGAQVVWQSGPAGRGRVTERVLEHQPLAGLTTDVHDDSINARQTVTFTPAEDRVAVELTLAYEIRKRGVFTPLVDFLFIRRAMERSIAATLARFGAELADRRIAVREH